MLANIPTLGLAEGYVRAGRFVNVAAEEVRRLMPLNKFSNGGAAKMLIRSSPIKRRIFRGAVANQDQRRF